MFTCTVKLSYSFSLTMPFNWTYILMYTVIYGTGIRYQSMSNSNMTGGDITSFQHIRIEHFQSWTIVQQTKQLNKH